MTSPSMTAVDHCRSYVQASRAAVPTVDRTPGDSVGAGGIVGDNRGPAGDGAQCHATSRGHVDRRRGKAPKPPMIGLPGLLARRFSSAGSGLTTSVSQTPARGRVLRRNGAPRGILLSRDGIHYGYRRRRSRFIVRGGPCANAPDGSTHRLLGQQPGSPALFPLKRESRSNACGGSRRGRGSS